MDFAADAKWEKRTARAMMRMVLALNEDHLARLEARPAESRSEPHRVECVTCHRGVARPETIGAVVERTLSGEGLDAALKAYRALRQDRLRDGSYDFSERPLNALGEDLLRKERSREALALLELNAELNSDSASAAFWVGEARLAAGDRTGAQSGFERALALDSGETRARARLDEMTAPSSRP